MTRRNHPLTAKEEAAAVRKINEIARVAKLRVRLGMIRPLESADHASPSCLGIGALLGFIESTGVYRRAQDKAGSATSSDFIA